MKKNKNDVDKQIERLKEISLRSCYQYSGDIYKILESEEFKKLLLKKPISKGNVKLSSSLIYGKKTISTEEKFIENLDKYVEVVRNKYLIDPVEQLMLIELSLSIDKYVDILYSTKDCYNADNHYYYEDSFKRLFLHNIYNNLVFYASLGIDEPYINRFARDTNELNFDETEDFVIIDKILMGVLNTRKDNLYQACIPHNEIKEEQRHFYIFQLEWVMSEYYKEEQKKKNTYEKTIKMQKRIKRLKIIRNILATILSIGICLIVYFIINRDYSYSFNGESENFTYTNALFTKSGGTYLFSFGSESFKNPDLEEKDIISVTLKSDDNLIIKSSEFLHSNITESIGYDEYFPKEVMENIDNWYLEVVFNLNDQEVTEIIKLEKEEWR